MSCHKIFYFIIYYLCYFILMDNYRCKRKLCKLKKMIDIKQSKLLKLLYFRVKIIYEKAISIFLIPNTNFFYFPYL